MNLDGSVNHIHTSLGTTASALDHDLLMIKAVLLLQRRYRFSRTLKSACSKRLKQNQLGWEAITDGDKYLLEYGTSSTIPRSTSHSETTSARIILDRRNLYQVISSFRTLEVPVIIFVKALRRGKIWNLDGELQDELLIQHEMIPRFVRTFFILGTTSAEDLRLPLARHLQFLNLRHKGGQWCLSIQSSMRKAILEDMTLEESRERHINVLKLFLQAFPDEHSQILWEELRLQLDGILCTTIIPILRVISLKDLQEYHAIHNIIPQEPFYTRLINFLLSIFPRYQFLDTLIEEIADHLMTYQDEKYGTNAKVLLQLHKMMNNKTSLNQGSPILRQLVSTDGRLNPILNAQIGIILGRHVSLPKFGEVLRTVHGMWTPLSSECPSSLETIASAYQATIDSTSNRQPDPSLQAPNKTDERFEDGDQDNTRDEMTLTIRKTIRSEHAEEVLIPKTILSAEIPLVKILVGFIYAQRGLFSLAKRILRGSMREVEQYHGPSSLEAGVIVAECAKCCNMLGQYGMAEQMLRSALQRRMSLESQPDSQYLQIILVDALLAKENYGDAAEILGSLISSQLSVSSAVVMKTALRMSKIHRRLGEVFPSHKISSDLIYGLRALDQVNDELRSAFLEEISRNIARVDSKNTLIYQEALELADALEEIQNHQEVDGNTRKNQAIVLQTYLGRINQFCVLQIQRSRMFNDSRTSHLIREDGVETRYNKMKGDTSRWDAYTFFDVTGRAASGMYCYGMTKRGSRCAWNIPKDRYDDLRFILDHIETQPPQAAEKWLRDIASLSLCLVFHQNQADGLIEGWSNILPKIPIANTPTKIELRKAKHAQILDQPTLLMDSSSMWSPNTPYSKDTVSKANLPLPLGGGIAYKRCGKSIIGLWAAGTRRKLIYGQLPFRVEVIFETPVFFVAQPENQRGPLSDREIHYIDGSLRSYKNTKTLTPEEEDYERMVNSQRANTADDERATWLILLSTLQKKERSSRDWDAERRLSAQNWTTVEPKYDLAAAIQAKTQSWDTILPQITKPYATTALCHLVEMMAMLGVYWKTFDPATWNLRAEGNGFALSSTNIQGLGVMVFFTTTGTSTFGERSVIPCQYLKQLSFGVVPTAFGDTQNSSLIPKTLNFGSVEGTAQTLRSLGISRTTITKYQVSAHHIFSLSFQIIGMLAKVFHIRGSSFRMLPNPTCDRWAIRGFSPTSWDTSRLMRYFHTRISNMVERENHQFDLYLMVSSLGSISTKQSAWLGVVERLHDALIRCDKFLQIFSEQDIMSVFVAHVTNFLEFNNLDMYNTGEEATFLKLYFDKILPLVSGTTTVDGNSRACTAEEQYGRQSIGVTLIFRMLCWLTLHDFDQDDVMIVPSNLQGSRMPVYIG